jgi:hypothetical protein
MATTFHNLAEGLERQRWHLMLHGPADELARVLSDGRIEQVIVLRGDALAVSGVSDMDVTVKGVSKLIKSISLVIWRRDDDVWRLVAHQNTLARLR